MSVSQSIFGVWRHLRALHALTRHHARNAPKTMAYKGLFGGIFGQRVPSDGLQSVVHAWSSDTIYLIQTNFLHKIMSITIVNDRISNIQ